MLYQEAQSNERKFKPSTSLVDYFILNIFMFYECSKRRFKFKDSDLPTTYKKVKTFRHRVMAHFDKKIKTNSQLVKEYIIINDSDFKGFDRIYQDYTKFRDKLYSLMYSIVKNGEKESTHEKRFVEIIGELIFRVMNTIVPLAADVSGGGNIVRR